MPVMNAVGFHTAIVYLKAIICKINDGSEFKTPGNNLNKLLSESLYFPTSLSENHPYRPSVILFPPSATVFLLSVRFTEKSHYW